MAPPLIDSLLEKCVCSNCHNHIAPPIRQCVIGHNICDECFPTLSNCSVCQRSKSDIRSFAREETLLWLRIPCRYQAAGCRVVVEGRFIKIHEDFCKYALRACPFRIYQNPMLCQWTGNLTELDKHCTAQHMSNYHIGPTILLRDSIGSEYFSIIYAYGRYFRGTFNTVFKETQWAVYLINETNNDVSYSYKIEFSMKDNSIVKDISLMAPCALLPKDDYSVNFLDEHLVVPKNMIQKYCDDENKLSYRITISTDIES